MPDVRRLSAPLVNLAIAIAIGAFGAHVLAVRVSEPALQTFKTGANYHLTVAAVWVALASANLCGRHWKLVSVVLCAGTLLFCGSLYALAITGTRTFGMITPLGGLTWIIGTVWIAFAVRSDHNRGE